MTQYAKMILELINQSDGHLTAEQLFLELKKKAPKVVQATVYNNLNTLCQEGLIRKVRPTVMTRYKSMTIWYATDVVLYPTVHLMI